MNQFWVFCVLVFLFTWAHDSSARTEEDIIASIEQNQKSFDDIAPFELTDDMFRMACASTLYYNRERDGGPPRDLSADMAEWGYEEPPARPEDSAERERIELNCIDRGFFDPNQDGSA